ncbi:MAG TPA: phage holin family protein [Myxococcota bacterium]|nr:phage holin family protein [Myxococcota bacterium]
MPGFFIRLGISALALWLAAAIVPGLHIEGVGTLVLAALLLGIVNAVVRPVVVLLTIPLTIVTLGLFLLVVNAGMLGLVAALLENMRIDGFFAALLGAVVVGVTSWIASSWIGPSGRVELLVVRSD